MSAVNVINAKTDLAKGVQMVRLGRLFASNDKAAHTINVRVLNDGAVADLTGQTISAYFIRPDNATVTVQGTLSGNVASITLPSSCYANSGHFSLIIKAVSTNTTTAIFWGDGTITRSTTDTIVDPENIIPSLEELLAQIAVMEQGTAAANAAATSANSAASAANTAATSAADASSAIQNITAAASNLSPGSTATATVSTVSGHKHIAFGIPIGHTPNLTIGTVQTLSEESDATATITGTQTAPILNLGIPRGRTGSAENVYASNVPMSTTDTTTIYEKLEDVTDDISTLQSQTVDISHGGTGATTGSNARKNLQTVKTNQTDDSVSVEYTTYTVGEETDERTRLNVQYAPDEDNKVIIHGDDFGVWAHKKENGIWRTVPQSISMGGTGATNAAAARTNLGINQWRLIYTEYTSVDYGAFQTGAYWAQGKGFTFSKEISWQTIIVYAFSQQVGIVANVVPLTNRTGKVQTYNLMSGSVSKGLVRLYILTTDPDVTVSF